VNAVSFGIALLTSPSWAASPTPGVERWPIKTNEPATANTAHPKAVPFGDIIQLADPPGVTKNDHRYQSTLIPPFADSLNMKEGQIVQTTGWLHLIAFEPDGDYHVQISASRDSGDQCLIVETPEPDPAFVKDTSLHPQLSAVRELPRSLAQLPQFEGSK
jgi:hypothetical protein